MCYHVTRNSIGSRNIRLTNCQEFFIRDSYDTLNACFCKCNEHSYVKMEKSILTRRNFFTNNLNILLRMISVLIIAEHSKSIDPDTFTLYLSMNYFDQFLSKDKMILKDVEGSSDTEKSRLIVITGLTIYTKTRVLQPRETVMLEIS